jgi:hypothetical protein
MSDMKKSIKDRVDELLQGIVDALEELVSPLRPELATVPVRAPRRPYRR